MAFLTMEVQTRYWRHGRALAITFFLQIAPSRVSVLFEGERGVKGGLVCCLVSGGFRCRTGCRSARSTAAVTRRAAQPSA